MMNIIRSAIFSFRFYRIVEGNYLEKARKTLKYCPRFLYQLKVQQSSIRNNL
jgi:hypothetical protein